MQRVGEVHAGPQEIQRLGHGEAVLDADLWQPQDALQHIQNGRSIQAVGEPQDPFGFEQDRLADVDPILLEERHGSLCLRIVVADDQADEDVGVNRDHRGP